MRETSTAALIGWSRSFPATPEQAGEARRFLAAILNGHPADDAILCLSELVTNATIHSRSRQPGGCLTVRVQRRDDHSASHRVEGAGRGLPGATVRARIPSVARSALSGITGKMAASFQSWPAADQS